MKKSIILFLGLCLGILLGVGTFFLNKQFLLSKHSKEITFISGLADKQVIGFLPYWLLGTAKKDYSSDITTLTYFGLVIDGDGSIMKLNSSEETEPGWEALRSGKMNSFFQTAEQHGVSLSLLLSSGGDDAIASLIDHPIEHARQLVSEVTPVLNKYHFTDLNLDIEYTQTASESSRRNFTQFVQTVKSELPATFSLTVEITGDDLIKAKLIDPAAIGEIADNVVVMAYDYHYPGSFVTGAVAPLSGAGTVPEYDVTTAIQIALKKIPSQKIILGVPLYGYEWETLQPEEHSAVIPGTGAAASNRRSELLLASCSTCSAQFNQQEQEMFVHYKDPVTGTYHQLMYPDQRSTESKIELANAANLGGVALWALGYEGPTILNPLAEYK